MVFVFFWVTSLSILISSCIHVAENGIIYFYGWIVFHCIYVPHLLYPFIFDGHLGCLSWSIVFLYLFMVLFYFIKIFNTYFWICLHILYIYSSSYILYLVCFISTFLMMLSLWFYSNISMCYFLQISLLWVHWTS